MRDNTLIIKKAVEYTPPPIQTIMALDFGVVKMGVALGNT